MSDRNEYEEVAVLLNPLRMQVLDPECLLDVLLGDGDRGWLHEIGIDVAPLPDYKRSNVDPRVVDQMSRFRELQQGLGGALEQLLGAAEHSPECDCELHQDGEIHRRDET